MTDKTADKLYKITVPSMTKNQYQMPTSKINSIFYLPGTTNYGVCTHKAFYIVNPSGTVTFTSAYPHMVTYKCSAKSISATSIGIIAIS